MSQICEDVVRLYLTMIPSNILNALIARIKSSYMAMMGGLEPPTQGLTVLRSTDWTTSSIYLVRFFLTMLPQNILNVPSRAFVSA